jgi:hypothetical protein
VRWRREQLEGVLPDLGTDEAIIDRWAANHTRDGVAVGGRLWLTTRRLAFLPIGFETKVMEREVWTCRLAAVTDVGAAPRGRSPWSGAWRRRLSVRHGTATDLFVVNRVGKKVEVIRAALAGEASRPER